MTPSTSFVFLELNEEFFICIYHEVPCFVVLRICE